MSVTSWTLEEALSVIRLMQPVIRALNYHITLGGGVLNTGSSNKNLDLWIIPLNGHESDPKTILHSLWAMFGSAKPLRDNPDYGPDAFPHAAEMMEYRYCGKRIDIFIQ